MKLTPPFSVPKKFSTSPLFNTPVSHSMATSISVSIVFLKWKEDLQLRYISQEKAMYFLPGICIIIWLSAKSLFQMFSHKKFWILSNFMNHQSLLIKILFCIPQSQFSYHSILSSLFLTNWFPVSNIPQIFRTIKNNRNQ